MKTPDTTGWRQTAGRVIRRFIAATVVVFLLFGPYYGNLLSARTRYYTMWQYRDTMLLLGCMTLLASLCVLLGEMVRLLRRPFLNRFFNHLFVVAFGAGVLANLWFHTTRAKGYHLGQFGMEITTLWLVLVGIVSYSMARPASTLVLRCRQLCQIASPIVVILVFQMVHGPTWTSGLDSLPPTDRAMRTGDHQQPARGVHPVYLFLLDAWSYDRVFDQHDNVEAAFPNLARLTERATVFTQACSPADNTDESIPPLLFEKKLPAVWNIGEIGFEVDGEFVPCATQENIFSRFSSLNYRTFVVGFCLPYRVLLGDDVNVYRSYPWLSWYRSQHATAAMALHAFGAMRYWTDPWSKLIDQKLRVRVEDARALSAIRDMERDVLDILTSQPRNTFAFFHYPCPHNPYLLDEEGNYRGPDKEAWRWSNLDGYKRNLAYTDRLIGKFVGALMDARRFDDALLIFTSDHAWAQDPEWENGQRTEPRTHVPLIVKLPGQDRPLKVGSRFETVSLGKLIRFVVNEDAGRQEVERFVTSPEVGGDPWAAVVANSKKTGLNVR